MTAPLKGGTGAAATAPGADAAAGSATASTTKSYRKKRDRHKLIVACQRLDGGGAFTVTGQTARALVALHSAGNRGVTALEVSTWAYRFAAYCFDLRRLGLDIETLREPHVGGWHGRHVLHTPVTLVGEAGIASGT